ncbi:aminopeptidase P family protein [Weissella diestrammenae]|uniref:Aminopeptidase P family protein n=1 Tax=Weissella diestrammenae TaxID=1162633 RepID=A0A7G9T611_9LACO|nr:Xaa-Pro peptidase family protein [Weissella diestrammenae]MCM0582371.1 aminopeptidase P family protein [Weissella diestrammenae]QNN75536.1 aminopeptidase P family protein [Weissella diestrammenae]
MNNKIQAIQQWLNENELDVAFLSDYHTISYLTGFESDPIERILALVVFAQNDPLIFAPALEVQAVKSTGWTAPVFGYQDHENGWERLAGHITAVTPSIKRWAIEESQLTVERAKKIQTALPQVIFTADITPKIQTMRLHKDAQEIEKMHGAGRDADRAFEYGFAALADGVSELAVAAALEFETKKRGIPGMSFETLVQFGAHAAEPHGATGKTQLKRGDMALFDLGTIYEGYVSDATRTVAYGAVSDHQRLVYQTVLEAQLAAQSMVMPGMTAGELDDIARTIITKAGFGEYFVHRLGHGLGSSVHEFPQIMAGNDFILEPGMAFSIEPGIYIPGDMGVRIEDSIVLTEHGAESFTHHTKDLQIID